ncbi:hypothetical protein [Paraflavitalea sp. CAU 1676]|uniref:hypothetical protein n=1 Tax=Paraflavitalea sp. CAU 1676 TaxID=3032598 RepID=UPI0023DC4995|nr:hypothetical protein [Paraflavitalea sp. CAU 1676]MDF2190260.1 hypothetical protein [Paraflavitalea sp. CAU 1676]
MRYLLFILLIQCSVAVAQLPRNGADQYEYNQQISLSVPDTLLTQRAKAFFLLPFIVHWDSVAFIDAVHTAKGHIIVRLSHGLSGFNVPVALQMDIAVKPEGYQFVIRQLEADKKDSKYTFPLEQKPAAVQPAVYEQLLQKTHRYMGSVISLLKRHMGGDL